MSAVHHTRTPLIPSDEELKKCISSKLRGDSKNKYPYEIAKIALELLIVGDSIVIENEVLHVLSEREEETWISFIAKKEIDNFNYIPFNIYDLIQQERSWRRIYTRLPRALGWIAIAFREDIRFSGGFISSRDLLIRGRKIEIINDPSSPIKTTIKATKTLVLLAIEIIIDGADVYSLGEKFEDIKINAKLLIINNCDERTSLLWWRANPECLCFVNGEKVAASLKECI